MICKQLQDGNRIIVVFDEIGNDKEKIDAFLKEINSPIPEIKQLQALKPIQSQPRKEKEPPKEFKEIHQPKIDSVPVNKETPNCSSNVNDIKHALEDKMDTHTIVETLDKEKKYSIIEIETMTVPQLEKALSDCPEQIKIKRDQLLKNAMYLNVHQYSILAGEKSLREMCKKLLV